MENFQIILDDGTGQAYDAVIQKGRAKNIRECGDLKVITKTNGTVGGSPVLLFTFTVRLPDGTLIPVQAATTAKLFVQVADVVKFRYFTQGSRQ